ncbi:hypothetical protein SPRG_03265 [Saprolegnia parasitica CBS 223.65]|uniref:Rab-GAP TBC domain-containing protein n=1 Tax=Saprolegnia parasitica (strain CBS 223.65) TaxID=695850 RepID=A0A067CZ08_SAPPC|nr:hypothetical protein SPRG_03265 [Saprolegnia parasitica CBS 223.65]KDO32047.1 hypothetical protein SPRG_03265 [Saprolegnia parasitica CBS 223.65]|eukprot:XP_012197235.1 hypothetical protein SPRG_03265 [Saprolegnia parasitica CBS 223.65]
MAAPGPASDYHEQSMDGKIAYIYERMKDSPFLGQCRNTMKQEVKKQLNAMDATDGPIEVNLSYLMQRLGLTQAIKNAVMDMHTQAMSQRQDASPHDKRLLIRDDDRKEPLDTIEAARQQWDTSMTSAFVQYCAETELPYLHETKDVVPTIGTRFLCTSDDFLQALQRIKAVNRAAHIDADYWCTIQPLLYTKTSLEMQQRYVELGPTHAQFGLDEDVPNIIGDYVYIANKNKIGDRVLVNSTVPNARQYAKTGCPINIRPHVWRQALNVVINAEKQAHFMQLQALTTSSVYATDGMYLLDVQQTTDSSDYFPFEDHLRSVMLAFSRDASIRTQAAARLESPVSTTMSNGASTAVPPSGVLPLSGLVMFAAPLCYLYNDPAHVYFIFREMYCRYWCQLHVISSQPNAILPLCKTFESLLVRTIPHVVHHLLQHGITPLAIAFPWIQSGFSGVLEIDQVLLLWDRVIGYDTLEILPIFAAALFTFRAKDLLLVLRADDVRDLFSEALEIQVLPILQHFLFPLDSE